MGRKANMAAILRGLRKLYPDAHCELDYKNPLELLVATILSAQCTDRRVNLVTKTLFLKYRTAQDYAGATTSELEGLIHPAGFFRAKAKSIQETAKVIAAKHGGKVPDRMEDLLEFRGVARKTANVILGTAFGQASGIVVDTHMKRVAFRLGLTDRTEPEKVERDLMKLVPKKDWIFFSQGMVWHGRRVCFARKPDCPICALRAVCPKRGV